ncbi:SAM-dependent methyltransferase [Paenibacillus helianthi]|uniref:SAM-dependent methyltransferase n=1 Tax=Paenibacillus helianthi TaxID=1349432 RepID=A0ABX3EQZ1_9BACL|nr:MULTISPECIES: class I SAM-dependent methyltransferase [Paenibacillus]OKP66174.1 SAM-dependent methyltransferase [Paenibacillus sp. P3E]OKP88354.1 SAM-dependent methyltransferase [Paenibacillus helianthi]OKP88990.1 SAM-dependent methyltransferase [Paenibacillus sp. P32E]
MIITTGFDPIPEIEIRAKNLAIQTGTIYAQRGKLSMAKMVERYGDGEILVVLQEAVRLITPGMPPMEFHPSMGFVRAKRIIRGEHDPMLEAAGMVPGDSVLDCTAGLGSDSLLFAVHGGEESMVTALESSLPLCALLLEGMSHYVSGQEKVNAALRRVRVVHSDHLAYLREQPDHSIDIVYFDPMFRVPLTDSAAISPLRQFANAAALSPESVAEAVRVARKTVLLKEKALSGEFSRLGFTELLRASAKTSYGVISIDN